MSDDLIRERDEALAFARSEAGRNASLEYQNKRHESMNKRNYEALRRIRETMKAHGYHGGNYLGLRIPHSHEYIGDNKYTPALEILEAFVKHLLESHSAVSC